MRKRSTAKPAKIKPGTLEFLVEKAAKGDLPSVRVSRVANENLMEKKDLLLLLLNRAEHIENSKAVECLRELMQKTKGKPSTLRKQRIQKRKQKLVKQKWKKIRLQAKEEGKKQRKLEKELARQKKMENKIAGLKFQMGSLAEELAVERGCNVSEVAKRKPITGQPAEEVIKLHKDEIKRLKRILRPIKQSKAMKAWWDSLSKKEKKDRSMVKHRWIDVSPEVRLERRIKQSLKTTKIKKEFEPHLFSSIEKLEKGMTPQKIQKYLIEKQKMSKKDAVKIVWKAVGIVTEELGKEEKK